MDEEQSSGFRYFDTIVSTLLLGSHLTLLVWTKAKVHGVLALVATIRVIVSGFIIAKTDTFSYDYTSLDITASVLSAVLVIWLAHAWLNAMAAVVPLHIARVARFLLAAALVLLVGAHILLVIFLTLTHYLYFVLPLFLVSFAFVFVGTAIVISIALWMLLGPFYSKEKYGTSVCHKRKEVAVVTLLALLFCWPLFLNFLVRMVIFEYAPEDAFSDDFGRLDDRFRKPGGMLLPAGSRFSTNMEEVLRFPLRDISWSSHQLWEHMHLLPFVFSWAFLFVGLYSLPKIEVPPVPPAPASSIPVVTGGSMLQPMQPSPYAPHGGGAPIEPVAARAYAPQPPASSRSTGPTSARHRGKAHA